MSATSPENPSYSGLGSKRAGAGEARAGQTSAGLYLVPTPIGNLRDITLRALDVLASVDLIACEDTRVTRKLLSAHGIPAPTLWTYNDHSNETAQEAILERVAAGEAVAVVSDAGTPLIADPGYRLISAAARRALPVTALPGPSAPLPALALSGLPTDRFAFLGFLPAKPAARRGVLRDAATLPMTLIFFESPHRIQTSLVDMADELGDRAAAVCRELSKIHEEILRGTLSDLAATVSTRDRVRGEIVIVVSGIVSKDKDRPEPEKLDERLHAALDDEGGVKDAAARVAAELGLPKREVYQRALALRAAARAADPTD